MCSETVCHLCHPLPSFRAKVHEENDVYKEFSAAEFLDNLLTKGSCSACDESANSFRNNDLPPYYNEEMYKRGQAYFHKHIFGMFLGNLLGLLSSFASKSALAVLILTKMSSSEMSAYKRYAATIFHMMIWYESEFKPGSRVWNSIKHVKSKHNSASKKSAAVLKYRINQKDMSLTLFGFMGFALARSEFLGIYDTNEEDLKGFVHVWRVIGYVMGIEDEFNMCRESVEETRQICNEIITRVAIPEFAKRDEEYRKMSSYLINGLWTMNPFLNINTFTFYLEITLNNSRSSANEQNLDYKMLTANEKFRLHTIFFVIDMMRYSLVRIVLNYFHLAALWTFKVFPYLAYYKFGKSNAHVNIMGTN